jgi:hypothetical protein
MCDEPTEIWLAFVGRFFQKTVVRARAVCLQDGQEWLINADMLAADLWKGAGTATGSTRVTFGKSLLSRAERRQLLPDWKKVFSSAGKRAKQKMKEADERAIEFVKAVKRSAPGDDGGYILVLGGVLSESVRELIDQVAPERIIVVDRDVRQLVHHEACRMLLDLPYHVIKCDLNHLLSANASEHKRARIAPDLPLDFLTQVTAFYADFCGAIHPNFQQWLDELPNLKVLAVTQAHRCPGERREFPDQFAPRNNRTFNCLEVKCRIYEKGARQQQEQQQQQQQQHHQRRQQQQEPRQEHQNNQVLFVGAVSTISALVSITTKGDAKNGTTTRRNNNHQ